MVGKVFRSRGMGLSLKITLVASCFVVLFSVIVLPGTFSTLLSGRELMKPSLPDFTNGGIIVFYHIYKTGGSTVGKMLHEISREDKARFPNTKSDNSFESFKNAQWNPSRLFFTMIRKSISWEDDCLETLDLAENHKKLVLLELHIEYPAPDFPSLVELTPMLDKWRAEADRRGVGFFAFTQIREPVAHALSFFNFFHVGNAPKNRPPRTRVDHDYWNPFRPLGSTEDNFLHSYFETDRQCRMLNSDPQATTGAPYDVVWTQKALSEEQVETSLKPCRVDKVRDTFFNSLDWVGTTENLQNETLPLLTKLIMDDPNRGRNNKPFKVFDNNPAGAVGMKKDDLSKKTMYTILQRTQLDRELYKEVTRNFQLSNLGWDYQSPVIG